MKIEEKLFDRDIIRKNIVIDSHNYFQGDDGDGENLIHLILPYYLI